MTRKASSPDLVRDIEDNRYAAHLMIRFIDQKHRVTLKRRIRYVRPRDLRHPCVPPQDNHPSFRVSVHVEIASSRELSSHDPACSYGRSACDRLRRGEKRRLGRWRGRCTGVLREAIGDVALAGAHSGSSWSSRRHRVSRVCRRSAIDRNEPASSISTPRHRRAWWNAAEALDYRDPDCAIEAAASRR